MWEYEGTLGAAWEESVFILGQTRRIILSFSQLGETGVSPLSWSCPSESIHTCSGIFDSAAQSRRTLMTLSSASTSTIEEVCGPCPSSLKWLQVYIYKDRELNAQLIRQAEAFGFKALAFTVDSPTAGHRRPSMRDPLVLPPGVKAVMAPVSMVLITPTKSSACWPSYLAISPLKLFRTE